MKKRHLIIFPAIILVLLFLTSCTGGGGRAKYAAVYTTDGNVILATINTVTGEIEPVQIKFSQTESASSGQEDINHYFKNVSFVHESDGIVFFCHSEMGTAYKFIYYLCAYNPETDELNILYDIHGFDVISAFEWPYAWGMTETYTKTIRIDLSDGSRTETPLPPPSYLQKGTAYYLVQTDKNEVNAHGYTSAYEYEFYTTDYLGNNKSESIYIKTYMGGFYWELIDEGYLYYLDISELFERAPAGLSLSDIYNESSVADLCRVNILTGSVERLNIPPVSVISEICIDNEYIWYLPAYTDGELIGKIEVSDGYIFEIKDYTDGELRRCRLDGSDDVCVVKDDVLRMQNGSIKCHGDCLFIDYQTVTGEGEYKTCNPSRVIYNKAKKELIRK